MKYCGLFIALALCFQVSAYDKNKCENVIDGDALFSECVSDLNVQIRKQIDVSMTKLINQQPNNRKAILADWKSKENAAITDCFERMRGMGNTYVEACMNGSLKKILENLHHKEMIDFLNDKNHHKIMR